MQDKSYQQAIQDLQDRLSNHFLDTLGHMFLNGTTVSKATLNIQNESERAVVKNTLITSQIIALLSLMKEMGILDKTQYNEFRAYLMQALTFEPGNR